MGRKSKEETNDVRNLGRLDNQSIQNDSGEYQQNSNYILGLDISTAVVGVCCIDIKDGSVKYLESIRLNRSAMKDWDRIDKVEYVSKELQTILSTYNFNVVASYVEDAHMAFQGGKSSAATLFSLARFNELVSYILFKTFETKAVGIGVRKARKTVGVIVDTKNKAKTTKEQVLEQVTKIIPEDSVVKWPTHEAKTGKHKGEIVLNKENEDKADAFVIARAGYLLNHLPKKPHR
jgi:Holliday junction resolvasome RuvABC endonuclease subunit